MPLLLGAVADDYTGASDLANTLNRNGLSTIQTIGVPASGLKVDDAEAMQWSRWGHRELLGFVCAGRSSKRRGPARAGQDAQAQ